MKNKHPICMEAICEKSSISIEKPSFSIEKSTTVFRLKNLEFFDQNPKFQRKT